MQHRAVTARISINKPSTTDILDVSSPKADQVSEQTSHASAEPVAQVPELQVAKDQSDRLCTPYPDMTPVRIMGRQYEIVSFPVSNSFTSQILKFPRDLAAFKALECGAASFKFLRAGLRLTVRIQSTIAQAGLMVVSWLPQRGPNVISPQQATGNNSTLLNYSTQDSVVIDIPWLNPLCWEATDADDSICTVYFHPLVPIRAPTTTDDFVTVVVYGQYLDPQLTGPQVAQSDLESYARGVPSTISSPVFQTIDGVANAVSGVSRVLGMLDKPDAPTNTRFTNIGMSDINSFVSSDTVVPSIPYSVNSPHLLPNSYNLFPYGHSGMTMTQLAARPMWAATKDITAVGDRLEFSLNPFSPRTVAGTPQDDYLSLAAGTARYFRGSQKIFVHFCTDQFTSCRFRVGVHYGPWSTSVLSSGDTMSRVVDVKGSTSTSVLIPYLQPTAWSTAASEYPTFFVAAVTAPVGASLPTTSTITVTLYRAGGPDTQFSWPSAEGEPLSRRPKPRAPKQEAQTNLNAHFSTSFQPIVEGVKLGREHGSSTTSELHDINQVLKTMTTVPMASADLPEFPYLTTHPFLLRFFRVFRYWRGSYRVYHTRFPLPNGLCFSSGFRTSQDGLTVVTLRESALPRIPSRLPGEADGIHLTIPWHSTVPYLPTTLEGPMISFYDRPVIIRSPDTPEAGTIHAYPGDDFVLGHLQAPSDPA